MSEEEGSVSCAPYEMRQLPGFRKRQLVQPGLGPGIQPACKENPVEVHPGIQPAYEENLVEVHLGNRLG